MKTLAGARMPQTTEILRLLRDNSIESKRLAILMIGKFRLTDLLSVVCECLNTPGLSIDASAVLRSFGPLAEDELVRYYLIKSGNIRLNKTVLHLLGRTCSKETKGFLFSRLSANSRIIKETAAKCLIDCNFVPVDAEKVRLNQLTSEIIGTITWNLSARIALEKDKDYFLLAEINKELQRCKEFLFNILLLTYGKDSVSSIRKSLAGESIEDVGFAIELINLVVADSVKSKLTALFSFDTDKQKLKKLYQFFPGKITQREELLTDIINRDYNLISLWTKACALRSISLVEDDTTIQSVTALLFSPEELMQEEAANLIARTNPGLYSKATGRLPDSNRKRIDRIFNGTIDKREMLFDKVQFLLKQFKGVPEDELLFLAGEMTYAKVIDKESQLSADACVIWFFSEENDYRAQLVFDGEFIKLEEKLTAGNNTSFYILTLNSVEEYHFQYPFSSTEFLKYIDNIRE
jgi:hypothetical protein